MPLSEYEQRVLEQMERDLGADPKLNSAMSKRSRPRGRWTFAFIGILAGLGVLIGAVIAQLTIVGVLAKNSTPAAASPSAAKPAKRQGFMNRVEERFERRRDQGDF